MLETLTQSQILFCLNHCGKPFDCTLLNLQDKEILIQLLTEEYNNLIIEIKRGIYDEVLHHINPEIFNEKALLEAIIKRTWNATAQNQNLPNC